MTGPTPISRRAALALSAGAVVAGCATGTPAGGLQPAADAAFEALATDYLDAAARLSPASATALGDHRFDAELDDLSTAGQAAQRAFLRAAKARLAGIDRAALSRANQVDAAMLENALDRDAFNLDDAETFAWDPLAHNAVAGGALYSLVARDFAPLPERLRSAAARLEKLPGLLAQTRAALTPERVPAVHAETYARQHAGLASIVDDLILANADSLSPNDRAVLARAAAAAKSAIADHQRWIEQNLKPAARGDFRLGAGLYDRKLALALNTPMERAEIKAAAVRRLAETRAEMAAIARGVLGAGAPADDQAAIAGALSLAAADRPPRERLVAEAERTLREATEFLQTRNVITLPDAPVKIIVMPEFQQGVAVAYCDSPGPLDRHLETFYAVSPIPTAWDEAQTASFLKEYNNRSLHELTVHEAMPGHYVQLWHSNKYPSTLRAALYSGPFVEGWACYAQDLMGEVGYWGNDPLRALVNKKWALRVISNAILDIGVHVEGMSEVEAMSLMTRDAFQEEREAAGKWTRARVTSAQLPTYFVGWTEHWALRREAEARAGGDFNMRGHHDRVLSFGSPPVRLARAMMFDQLIA